jgi:hypothetical protein
LSASSTEFRGRRGSRAQGLPMGGRGARISRGSRCGHFLIVLIVTYPCFEGPMPAYAYPLSESSLDFVIEESARTIPVSAGASHYPN